MALAHAALHFVFEHHAGFLKSYESDERKRMLMSFRIVQFADDNLTQVMNHAEHDGLRFSNSEFEAYALPRIKRALKQLLHIAPSYVAKTRQRVPCTMTTAAVALGAFRVEVDRRLVSTQWDRG